MTKSTSSLQASAASRRNLLRHTISNTTPRQRAFLRPPYCARAGHNYRIVNWPVADDINSRIHFLMKYILRAAVVQ